MIRKTIGAVLIVVLVAFAHPGVSRAIPLILDYTGFSWSTRVNGDPTTFSALGVLDGFSAPVADPMETYTFYLYGLTLSQTITQSPSVKQYAYSGGHFDVYRSTGPLDRSYNYGTNPAGGGNQASFIDGAAWLTGSINGFLFTYNSTLKLGNLSAQGLFDAGEFFPNLLDRNWTSFSGVTGRTGNGIPTGYDYRLDGQETSAMRPIPEAGTLVLVGIGLVGLGLVRKAKQNA